MSLHFEWSFSLFVFLAMSSVEEGRDDVSLPVILVGLPFSLRLPLVPFLALTAE